MAQWLPFTACLQTYLGELPCIRMVIDRPEHLPMWIASHKSDPGNTLPQNTADLASARDRTHIGLGIHLRQALWLGRVEVLFESFPEVPRHLC